MHRPRDGLELRRQCRGYLTTAPNADCVEGLVGGLVPDRPRKLRHRVSNDVCPVTTRVPWLRRHEPLSCTEEDDSAYCRLEVLLVETVRRHRPFLGDVLRERNEVLLSPLTDYVGQLAPRVL